MFFYSLMSMQPEARKELVSGMLAGIAARLHGDSLSAAHRSTFEWVRKLAELWPGDLGAAMPLSLTHVVLEPGQGMFIAPGEPHAYLCGTGLELMANSDNVIRAALSDKHIDMMEFISALTFSPGRPTIIAGSGELESVYHSTVEDFQLSSLIPSCACEVLGPEIILAGEGSPIVRCGTETLRLARGQSAFVRADAGNYVIEGEGLVWRARTAPPAIAPVSGTATP